MELTKETIYLPLACLPGGLVLITPPSARRPPYVNPLLSSVYPTHPSNPHFINANAHGPPYHPCSQRVGFALVEQIKVWRLPFLG